MAYYKPEELENIKRGLEWAKKNPADPKSIEIQNRLKSGQLNFELKALGLNEVPVKVPKVVMPTTPQEQGMMSEAPKDGTIKEAGKDMLQTAQSIGQTVSQGAQNIQDIAGNKDLTFAQKSMGVLGSLLGTGAKTIGDVTTGVGKLALTQEAEDSLKSFVQEKAQGIADTEVVKKVADWYQNLDQDNKLIVDSAGGFVALVSELAGGGVAGKASTPIKEGVSTALDKSTDLVKSGITKIDDLSTARNIKKVAAQEAKVDDAVGRIIQGSPEDIVQARRALSEIDTEGVASYEDLNKRIDDTITTFAKRVDAELEKDTNLYKKESLARSQTVKDIKGEKINVADMPIIDALDQLETFYSKTGNMAGASKIKQYKAKLDSNGLLLKEINDIAKMHGRDLSGFNANGELASGLSKQSAENTRKGLKETVRQKMPDDATKILDEKMSDLYATKDLTVKMEDKVQKLYQKIKNRTLPQKVGGAIADVVDLASLGSLRGFVQKLLPSNVGLKTANSLDLEKELSKNLAQIDKLLKMKEGPEFEKAVTKYISENQVPQSIPPETSFKTGETPTKLNIIEKPEKITLKELYDSKLKLSDVNEEGDLVDYREELDYLLEKGYGEKSINEIINDDTIPNGDKGVLKYIKKNFIDDLSTLSKEHELDKITPSLRNTGLYQKKGETDFTGSAEKLGLNKFGITDDTVSWVEEWVNRYDKTKALDVPKTVQNQLSKYKPTQSVTLYRGGAKGENVGQFSSWTYDKKVAQRFANRVKGGGGEVVEKVIEPNQIVVDFTKLPDRLLDKATKQQEAEVIVNLQSSNPQ